MLASIESAIEDIKRGKLVIVVDDEDRENEGDFVDELKAIDSKLPPLGVNYYGGLREWIEDYKEVSTGLL